MQPITNNNFGFVIAFLLPGFVALYGVSFQSELVRTWLAGDDVSGAATVGGFLYSTLSALIVGLLCSTVRWILLDFAHHATGIRKPDWNFRLLQDNLGAYSLLEHNHYRYYQFYGNSLVAWFIGFFTWRSSERPVIVCWEDALFASIAALLYLGSRDTLRKYYTRVLVLLSK